MLHRFVFCLAVLAAGAAQPGSAQVLLAGGSLPVCSSMSGHGCEPMAAWPQQALERHLYRVTTARIDRWQASLGDGAESPAAREWQTVLEQLAEQQTAAGSRSRLSDPLRVAAAARYDTLDERARWQMLDHFQEPVGARGEKVRLSDSSSQATIEIFERFVAMAGATSGRERPRIGVSTASSRDPYDSLDFYLQVIEQAGAEVYWLPLDRAFSAARAASRCEDLAGFQAELLGAWDRDRVFPALFQQQLALCDDSASTLALAETLDGVFLNGGNQWLTLHAFIDDHGQPTREWQRILARLEAGELVLGGTSAGAAVQSGPVMISNGSSRRALLEGAHERPPPRPGCDRAQACPSGLGVDSLTFHRGGLGSFALGIVDTHFSERWRQFRLLQLMVDSDIALGLGVDETSAIEVSGLFDDQPVTLQAHGDSGGWLILTDRAIVHSRQPLQIDGVVLHYLGPGARLELDDGGRSQASPEAMATPAQKPHTSGCAQFDNYGSFAELPAFTTRAAARESHCLVVPLDDTTVARSELVPLAPKSATGPVSSWSWSLEVGPGRH